MSGMMILIIVVVCAFVFIGILNRGSDSRTINTYTRERDDETQEKALKQILENNKQMDHSKDTNS